MKYMKEGGPVGLKARASRSYLKAYTAKPGGDPVGAARADITTRAARRKRAVALRMSRG